MGDPNKNSIAEIIKVHTDVPTSWGTLTDLGTVLFRKGVCIINALNRDVSFRFVNGQSGNNSFTVPAGFSQTFNMLQCDGVVEYKAESAPASGKLYVNIW